VSGNRASSVVWIELNPLSSDPREQLRRATSDLDPGRNVRVRVNMPPVPFGFPIPTHLDFAWCRSDLRWQFESDPAIPASADWSRDWAELANYIRGLRR
jgi:hypothetical protein